MERNPREVLGSIGQCIYCRSKHGPLQTEHIIPYGLNGHWELEAASCQKCSKITSQFERSVLRGPLIISRVALDLSTRNKGNRPNEFPFTITKNDS